MITVAILINGQPIFTRTATNESEQNERGETKYLLDTGEVLWHYGEEGAIDLAKAMLETFRGRSHSSVVRSRVQEIASIVVQELEREEKTK